jgi:formiminotetrahydrofolate cyclodeaminase
MLSEPTNPVESSKQSIAAYAAALASDTPTPGGGSAAAVTAALAVSLGEKVCRFTVGKPAFAEFEIEMTAALARFAQARARLLQLAADDETAYTEYARASTLPRTTDDERAARKAAMSDTLQESAKVPLEVAKEATEFLAALETVAKHGNRNLISDVSVAAYLAEAAMYGAVALVRSNAAYLKTEESSEMVRLAIMLERNGRARNKTIQEIIDGR